jgi:hypothetical protein
MFIRGNLTVINNVMTVVITCKIDFLGFVHHLNYNMIKSYFKGWILLLSSGRKGGGADIFVGPPG